MIGGVAGAASVFGNTPIDVVKTRMQVRYNELACHIPLCKKEKLTEVT